MIRRALLVGLLRLASKLAPLNVILSEAIRQAALRQAHGRMPYLITPEGAQALVATAADSALASLQG